MTTSRRFFIPVFALLFIVASNSSLSCPMCTSCQPGDVPILGECAYSGSGSCSIGIVDCILRDNIQQSPSSKSGSHAPMKGQN